MASQWHHLFINWETLNVLAKKIVELGPVLLKFRCSKQKNCVVSSRGDFRCIELLSHNFSLSLGSFPCSFEAVDGVPRVSPQVGCMLPKTIAAVSSCLSQSLMFSERRFRGGWIFCCRRMLPLEVNWTISGYPAYFIRGALPVGRFISNELK